MYLVPFPLRIFSDLHLERDIGASRTPGVGSVWAPSPRDDDPDTVLVLAGDIWNGTRPLMFAGESWLEPLSRRFKAVVVVLGNHDYWGGGVYDLPGSWRKRIATQGLHNVHLLELADGVAQGRVVIDGVQFLGGTLWTSMNQGDPFVRDDFDRRLGGDGRYQWNDRNYIRGRGYSGKLASRDWLAMHARTVSAIRDVLDTHKEPAILVTHHAPCMKSVEYRSASDFSQYLYGSELSNVLLDYPQLKLAIHGHTHMSQDYDMGDIRVVCNPRGYEDLDPNYAFNETGLVT